MTSLRRRAPEKDHQFAEAVLRDEQAVFTVAGYDPDYQVTLSLLGVLSRPGIRQTHHPRMSDHEHEALDRSAATLRQAVATIQ